jgi:hypothetical protein
MRFLRTLQNRKGIKGFAELYNQTDELACCVFIHCNVMGMFESAVVQKVVDQHKVMAMFSSCGYNTTPMV